MMRSVLIGVLSLPLLPLTVLLWFFWSPFVLRRHVTKKIRAWSAVRAIFIISTLLLAGGTLYAGEMKRGDAAHACRRMMQTKQYVGCWSGGEMFGKFSVAFDPDGEGFLLGGMSACPFRWRADDKGNIILQMPAPYGEVQEIKACYDPETDTMRLSNGTSAGYRDVKVTSTYPGKELQRAFNARMERKMEQSRREKNSDRKTAKRTFANIDALLDWLVEMESPVVAKSVDVPTEDPRMSDMIAYDESSKFFAILEIGYFERGERPPEKEIAALRWQNGNRTRHMPSAQVQCLKGVDEMKKVCAEARLPVDVRGVRQKASPWWYCCKDLLDLRVPKDRRADFQKALEARLAGRFPCTVNVTTITRKGRR